MTLNAGKQITFASVSDSIYGYETKTSSGLVVSMHDHGRSYETVHMLEITRDGLLTVILDHGDRSPRAGAIDGLDMDVKPEATTYGDRFAVESHDVVPTVAGTSLAGSDSRKYHRARMAPRRRARVPFHTVSEFTSP